jgi:DNA invertase Pin-like site-specific DNA recombinase
MYTFKGVIIVNQRNLEPTARTWGYARVSSNSQSLQRQLDQLLAYNIGEREIVCDKSSGKDFERTGYIALKTQMLRSGDKLVICELDRLGRDYELIKAEYKELSDLGIAIVVLDSPALSTADKSDLERTLISNIIFELLSYTAQKSRAQIKIRQAQGIQSAHEKGIKFGRPSGYNLPQGWAIETAAWRRGEQSAVQCMQKLGLKKTAFYSYVKKEGV